MKSVLTIATAGALAVILAACGGSGGARGGQNFVDDETFTMVLGADPGNLDPHFSTLSVTMPGGPRRRGCSRCHEPGLTSAERIRRT
ncbi:hypothetical protein FHU38_002262 [Saccharomonospora amisosensis]|uniref:Uncharacterized protein n=1 Tax=Saccharomonospora amisosensis TaxID=1128677 RepID=A0A7X5ZQJ8_9PSEU|nr:hypothetical protein [Saccharomonospora amisosensis]NIJ11918.1 hypothetical protein [Saccharomonospora amisosensis]